MKDLGAEQFLCLIKQRQLFYVNQDNLEDKIIVKGKRPDFYVWLDDKIKFMVEVESFKKDSPLILDGNAHSIKPDETINRIRSLVKEGSKQLGPYRDDGIPMLIALMNPRGIVIDMDIYVLVQLFGTAEVRGEINNFTQGIEKTYWFHGGGRTLSPNWRTYVSGVATIAPKKGFEFRGISEEIPLKIRIIHNPFDTKSPLPFHIFSDPEDEHWIQRDNNWIERGSV